MTTSPAGPQAGDAARPLAVAVLAAGKGTRLALGDETPPKVLLDCLGVPLLEHVRRAVAPLAPETVVVVTGYDAERGRGVARPRTGPRRVRVRQIPQEGTGQALRLALEAIPDFDGDVLVVYGDVPAGARGRTSRRLLRRAPRRRGAAATVLTGVRRRPGRARARRARTWAGRFVEIVEARDAVARPDVLALSEFNTGLYAFDADAAAARARGPHAATTRRARSTLTDAVNRIAAAGRQRRGRARRGSRAPCSA